MCVCVYVSVCVCVYIYIYIYIYICVCVCACVCVGSMCGAEGWNDTEVRINISNLMEASNASEDVVEDDNETTEPDANLSNANLVSIGKLLSGKRDTDRGLKLVWNTRAYERAVAM